MTQWVPKRHQNGLVENESLQCARAGPLEMPTPHMAELWGRSQNATRCCCYCCRWLAGSAAAMARRRAKLKPPGERAGGVTTIRAAGSATIAILRFFVHKRILDFDIFWSNVVYYFFVSNGHCAKLKPPGERTGGDTTIRAAGSATIAVLGFFVHKRILDFDNCLVQNCSSAAAMAGVPNSNCQASALGASPPSGLLALPL